MRVRCRTNLDLYGEIWPEDLPAVPRVGDEIESATVWSGKFQLSLQVVSVTWKMAGARPGKQYGEWYPEIELHMTTFQQRLTCRRRDQGCDCCTGSITAFYEWYAPLVGRTVGSFI